MFSDTFPKEVICHSLGKLNCQIDIFHVEDVLDDNFDLDLGEGLVIEIPLDCVLEENFGIER